MKLSELPTRELEQALRDTERVAPGSQSARILRRELERRRGERAVEQQAEGREASR